MKKIALLAIVTCFLLSGGAFAQTGNGMALLENPRVRFVPERDSGDLRLGL